mgnify:CR=1 FL=1
MQYVDLVNPWIPPELPESVVNLFMENGKIQSVRRGYISHYENTEPDPIVMVVSGVMSHAIINDELGKSTAISLIPAKRMTGFSNFFTRVRMPTRAETMDKAELCSISYKKLLDLIIDSKQAYMDFSKYKERGNKADLYGMLTIMTQPVDERLKMMFASILLATGYKFQDLINTSFRYDYNKLREWTEVPFRLTRQNIAKIVYSSGITIDRHLAEWAKEGVLKREGPLYSVRPEKLISAYEWIVLRS